MRMKRQKLTRRRYTWLGPRISTWQPGGKRSSQWKDSRTYLICVRKCFHSQAYPVNNTVFYTVVPVTLPVQTNHPFLLHIAHFCIICLLLKNKKAEWEDQASEKMACCQTLGPDCEHQDWSPKSWWKENQLPKSCPPTHTHKIMTLCSQVKTFWASK